MNITNITNIKNETCTVIQDRPCPINIPTKKLKSTANVVVDTNYINIQIDLFETLLTETIQDINKVINDSNGKKNDWDVIYFPILIKIKTGIAGLIKLIKKEQPTLFDFNIETKLDQLTFQCFSMMIMGDKYFPN
jgi:hypothetical protein